MIKIPRDGKLIDAGHLYRYADGEYSRISKKSSDEAFVRFAENVRDIIGDMTYDLPEVPAILIPESGIGDVSDGYHTFIELYYQRMMLFAVLVKIYKDRAWKSWKHEDGKQCFDGGWFIVGIDTPEGSYTYHYEGKYFDMFDCPELPTGKHWDGHTEKDVTRLFSLI